MTLEEIKELVMAGKYHFSQKVMRNIEDGWFSEADLEHCICNAKKIYKSERDEMGTAVDGKKIVIYGKDTHGYMFYTCGKPLKSDEGKIYFFITAHKANKR